MTTTNTAQPCRVYLHPTAAHNPSTVRAIVERTGLAVVIGGNRAAATLEPRKRLELTPEQRRQRIEAAGLMLGQFFAAYATRQSRKQCNTPINDEDTNPFPGGSAA